MDKKYDTNKETSKNDMVAANKEESPYDRRNEMQDNEGISQFMFSRPFTLADIVDKESYNKRAYQLTIENTKHNSDGKAVVSKDDEWRDESEWDDIFGQMKKEKGI